MPHSNFKIYCRTKFIEPSFLARLYTEEFPEEMSGPDFVEEHNSLSLLLSYYMELLRSNGGKEDSNS